MVGDIWVAYLGHISNGTWGYLAKEGSMGFGGFSGLGWLEFMGLRVHGIWASGMAI